MASIEKLLTAAGERFAYAVGSKGDRPYFLESDRVHPGNAYEAEWILGDYSGKIDCIFLVECGGRSLRDLARDERAEIVTIDHHRPGDPGHGTPPERFLEGSSIGQVMSVLATSHDAMWWADRGQLYSPTRPSSVGEFVFEGGCWMLAVKGDCPAAPVEWVRLTGELAVCILVAAADHCLEAAYRGRCPGVDPDALMRWRAESRATFQKRPVEAVLADIEVARTRLRTAVQGYAIGGGSFDAPGEPTHTADREYADLRGEQIPELPEAACREGIPFLSTVRDRDGREKVVLQAAPADLVRRFLAGEIVPGLCDYYGSPERGLAGGYTTKKE
jgi:hypothetical protein